MAYTGPKTPGKTQTFGSQLIGASEVQKRMAEMVKDLDDLRPAWDAFYRPHFNDAMDETFRGNQDGSWRALKKRYKHWKAAHGGAPYLMQMKGDLRDALTGRTEETVYRPQARQLEIGAKAVGPGQWNSPNTPLGRIIIYAKSSYMTRQMDEAVREHAASIEAAWSGRTWKSRGR